MKRLIRNALLFSIPLMLWGAFVAVIDPFGYFSRWSFIDSQLKIENARDLNSLMFNALRYRGDPSPYVILGDSRSARIPIDSVTELTGKPYARISSNAAKLNEIIDLYWYAADKAELERVYICLNFNMFNRFAYADRVGGVRAAEANPFVYLYSRSVGEAAVAVARAHLRGERVVPSKPPMSVDAFWDWMVREKARQHYERYEHPDEVLARLQEVGEHARGGGVELTFIVVPHHVDFRARVSDFDLEDESAAFLESIRRIAPVVDFDWENEFTRDRSNFGDPIHMNKSAAERVVREVWGDTREYGRWIEASASSPDRHGRPR